ncbi:class I adenylate-forming enzyme family protein [Novosphingobium sediminis]|nr:AMP-binding protein [Novosphingobium sediminis]
MPQTRSIHPHPCRNFGMRTIGEILLRNANWWPERDAFVLGDQRRTYRDLYLRGARLASALEKRGVVRQDRIGMVSTNSIEHFEFFAAADIAGFIAVPLSFRAAPPELEYLVVDSGTSILFFEKTLEHLADSVRQSVKTVRHFVCVGGEAPDWAEDFETFLASGDEEGPVSRSEAGDVAYLYYTSGTTGKPKGVPWSHRAMTICASTSSNHWHTSMLQISPAFHSAGRTPSLGCYWRGGKTVLNSSFDPTALLDAVQSERIVSIFLVPTMLIQLLDHPRIDEYDLSSLRMIMLGGARISTSLLKRAIARVGEIFYLGYGSTEAGAISILPLNEVSLDGDEAALHRLSSVGHFEAETDGIILDEAGNPCAVGVVGEVCIYNCYLFDRYWNNDIATIEAFHGNAFRTGDLGYMDEQGYIFLVDRKKDMVITGGENVYSREVEEAIDLHSDVRESAVIGKPDPYWGEIVLAAVVRNPGTNLTEEELVAFVRTRIAAYKCPRQVVFVDELPRQVTGKTDKLALRSLYAGSSGMAA